MIETRLTEMLEIKYPTIQSGMANDAFTLLAALTMPSAWVSW
jgi:hypothetical protein